MAEFIIYEYHSHNSLFRHRMDPIQNVQISSLNILGRKKYFDRNEFPIFNRNLGRKNIFVEILAGNPKCFLYYLPGNFVTAADTN